MNINATIRESIADLAIKQEVFNRAADLRAAGIPIALSIPDDRMIQHTAGDLFEKLETAAAQSELQNESTQSVSTVVGEDAEPDDPTDLE